MTGEPQSWSVETQPDVFEYVSRTTLEVDAGALIFRDGDGTISVAYAPGVWITVTPRETT